MMELCVFPAVIPLHSSIIKIIVYEDRLQPAVWAKETSRRQKYIGCHPPKKSGRVHEQLISCWSDSDRLRLQNANRPEPYTLLKHTLKEASASSQSRFSMEPWTSSTLLKQPEAKTCVTCDQLPRPRRGRGDVCEEQTHTCSLRASCCCSHCVMPSTVACQSLPAQWWLQVRPRPRKIHAKCSRICRYSGQMPLKNRALLIRNQTER